jgi:pimeloyl-ACP methyl ester carboxylesterase
MKLAFWPGLGGESDVLDALAPAFEEHGIHPVVLDPRYGDRADWSLDTLAQELVATGADVYAGHSWGAAVAARAAAIGSPSRLVLLDGGFIAPPEFVGFGAEPTADLRVASILRQHAEMVEQGEALALSGPQLEAIIRGYEQYDATATLAALGELPVLLVVARVDDQVLAARDALLARFVELVPRGAVVEVDASHDVVDDMGPALARLLADWLLEEAL